MLLFVLLLVRPGVACERREIFGARASDGFITSPNYPLPYPPDQDCIFNLTAAAGLVIHISFTHFHLEPRLLRSNQCLNDYVVVTVSDRQGRQHVGERLCGTSLPPPIHTMQSALSIRFHSSHANHFSGFRIRYQFLPEKAILEPASSYYDTDLRYQKNCGGHNQEGSLDGEIFSPGYPATFPKNVSCNWLIRVNPNKKIYIRLRYLELSPTMAECERASLYIIDGYRHETPDLRKDDGSQVRFCGGQLYYSEEGMKSYLSTGNRLIVRFVTRDHPTLSQLEKYEEEGKPIGFRLVWTEVEELLSDGKECLGFACSGGQLCIDNGQNICASRSQLCINKSLMCNGVSNCAENDHSDEQHCYSQHILLSACSIILILILVIFFAIIWQRSRTARRVQRRAREKIESASLNRNGKGAPVWECARPVAATRGLPLHRPPSSAQNHELLSEMRTFRPALL
ncbi:Neuropilin and tolloid-like protein 1 [Toxocara canis]|uniref:Neuropilin and tolloid-like protein 1 n=1 Tax=Toxocara canis TaxID=6265 RepID=A0A0B2VSH8_TOXCA|nr:Neuropilin and tolloid-like protein 1 [Toxocara canis]